MELNCDCFIFGERIKDNENYMRFIQYVKRRWSEERILFRNKEVHHGETVVLKEENNVQEEDGTTEMERDTILAGIRVKLKENSKKGRKLELEERTEEITTTCGQWVQ